MSNFDIANIALQAVCPGNEMLYDDKGLPSVMVKIPKKTWAQLGLGDSTDVFPAWIVNGEEVDFIYFSKYQNSVGNSRAYSLPAQDPKTEVALDKAIEFCSAKGEGWHVCTRLEWMAVALWCLKNNFLPLGNNNYGKDVSENLYKAVPVSEYGGENGRVATGTGPLTWSHDGTLSGIWDMNGNIWEWNGGVRFVKGELQVISNDGVTFGNDAADTDNSQSATSSLWRAIDGTTGALIAPDGNGTTSKSLKLDWYNSKWKWVTGALSTQEDAYRNCLFEEITTDSGISEFAKRKLQALGLLKSSDSEGIYDSGKFFFNNGADERAFHAGGHFHNGTESGIFAACVENSRTKSDGGLGFRATYIKLPTV